MGWGLPGRGLVWRDITGVGGTSECWLLEKAGSGSCGRCGVAKIHLIANLKWVRPDPARSGRADKVLHK